MKKITTFLLIMIFLLSSSPAHSLRQINQNHELVLNIASRKLILYTNGQPVKEYSVGVGAPLTPTPLGNFKLVRKIYNPAWVNPYRQSKVFEPGKSSPIGQYWLGFAMNKKKQEYGFHSTSDLSSIGRASTHGCIRMYPAEVEELFNIIVVGTAVHVIYNPVEIKEFENKLFVSAHPDIYNYMTDEEYVKFAKNQLSGANLIKEENLYKALSAKDGKDYFIGWTGANRLNEQDAGPIEKGRLQ